MSNSISTTIGLDIGGFLAPLRTLNSQVIEFRGVVMSLQTAFQGIVAIGSTVTAVFRGVFGALEGSISAAADLEQTVTSMGVLLGNKGAAQAMADEMLAFSSASHLSMETLSTAASTMLSFGVAGERIMPTLRQLGDVSGGNPDAFKRLALAFAQTAAAGRLMGQDLLQYINAGFNPLEQISRKTGKSMIELKKDVEAGNVSFEMVAQAFEDATSSGGRFFGFISASAATWNGLIASIGSQISTLSRTFGQPLMEALKPALASIVTQLGALVPLITKFGAAAGSTATATLALAGIIASAISALAPFTPLLKALVIQFALTRFAGTATFLFLRNQLVAFSAALRTGGIQAGMQQLVASFGNPLPGGGFLSMAQAGLRNLLSSATAATAAIMGLMWAWDHYQQRRESASLTTAGKVGDELQKNSLGLLKDVDGIGGADEKAPIIERLNEALRETHERIGKVDEEFKHLGRSGEADAERSEITQSLHNHAERIERLIQRTKDRTAAQMAAVAAQRQEAQATAEHAKQIEELTKSYEALQKEIAEDRFNALKPEQQKQQLIDEAGTYTTAQVDEQIRLLELKLKTGRLSDAEMQRLARLIEMRKELVRIERRIATERERQAEKEAETKKKREGFSKEKQIEIAKFLAEGRGDEKEVDRLDRQQRYDAAFKEATSNDMGPMEADSYARQKVAAEDAAKAAKAKTKMSSVSADSDRRVGLGGAAGGDLLLREGQRQTRELELQTGILKRVENAITKQPVRMPPSLAVFARG